MKNLTSREKALIFFLLLVVVVVVFVFLIIRPLNNKIADQEAIRAEKARMSEQYNQLSGENAEAERQLNQTQSEIKDLENSFLPELNTEAILQYLMQTFEDNGCPYLFDWETTNIDIESATLPDGSAFSDKVNCKRISLSYSSTDGYGIPEYNRQPLWYDEFHFEADAITSAIQNIGYYGLLDYANAESLQGYNEFITAIKLLAKAYPNAIKINKILVEDTTFGYIHMTAEIDFYSFESDRRLSVADVSPEYITFAGNTNVDCSGGLVGQPLIVFNTNNEFAGTMLISDAIVEGDREFASWFTYGLLQDAAGAEIPYIIVDEDGELTVPFAEIEYGDVFDGESQDLPSAES